VLDETMVVQSTGHHPMETRTAMAYWQNGKLYIHCSTQSVAQTQPNVARWCGVDPAQVVLISEYTGGGFGSKGGGTVTMCIRRCCRGRRTRRDDAHHARDESYIGRARTNMSGRTRIGFAKDGRILALDLFIVQDNGSYGRWAITDPPVSPRRSSTSRPRCAWRAISVITNTPPPVAAALAGPDAVQRDDRAAHHEGGQAARRRPGGDPEDELAGRPGDLGRRSRTASARS